MNLPCLEKLEILPSVVFEEVRGDLVLLELETGSYYGLNEVGALIFRALERQSALGSVVDELHARYAIPRENLEADCASLIEGLLHAGLVRQRTT